LRSFGLAQDRLRTPETMEAGWRTTQPGQIFI
jgi:hypothetical protein